MLFILNSDLQIIDTLSVKGIISQGNTPYFEDYYTQILATGAETFEFKTMADSRESRNIIVGNYIAFRDDNGDDKLFNIIETNESRSEQGFIKSVYCEMHGIELKNNVIRPMKMLNTSLEKFAETILSDTDWQVGEIDDFGGLLDINIEEHISVYDAIQKYAIGEFGAEIYYTVEIKSNSVVNKYLNIVENRGLDEGIKFTYNKNIQNIERTIDTSNLCTALIGVGNNGLTFKNIEASDKPLNQDFIVNETAYQQWSKNGYHIFGYETFETDSDQELLKLTRNKLYERGTPRVKYELNVELLDADVRIGDYVRITDMEFEPPIMLEARISTLTKSKTDINGNQCEISNFKHLQSNITEQMRKLSSNLKGYADNINIDNISKGGFLSSKITVVDESTLGIGNQVETGKDFCVDFKNLTAETVLTDFVLPNKKVMQQAIVDYHENKIYISCDETSNGNVVLYQTDMSGKILGQMTLNQFGHSNSFGIERRNNRTYIWLECDAKQAYSSEPQKLRGTKLCYFEFKDGVTANKTYGTVIDILPGWVNLSLGIDDTYNQIAVRALDKIGGTYYYHVFNLDEVINGTFKAKYKFKDVGLQGTSSYQGFDILGNYIYAIQGAGYYTHPPKMDSYVTCIDIQSGKKRYVNLIDILPNAPFREIEGIKVIKKSARVYELNFGMVTEHQSPRKNHVFKYTYTVPLESNPQGKFVHPNGWTTSISEGLIKVDNSKKKNYLMYVVDGERFKFEEGFSKQIIMANYENGIWYCNGEEFKPMTNDCIIGKATPNQDNYFDLTIYSESSQSLGSTLSGNSDSLMYEDGKIIVNAGGLVGQLPTDLIEVESINANHISANAITADKIQSNSIESKHIKAEVFEAINADIENLIAGKADIENLNAINANIQNLVAKDAEIENLVSNKATIEDLKASNAEIDNLKASNAEIKNLVSNKADIEQLNATNATINTLNANKANITDLQAVNAQINNLKADKADITELNAVKGNITILQSEVAEIGSIKSDVADIEHILAGNITADNIASGTITSDKIQTGTITSGSGIIADGAIGNAQISSLEASKISSGTIDTSKVTVQGTNGHLRIKGNRLQVFNGTGNQAKERVSVGDVNGDGTVYGLRVRGADGTTVLLDENGVTSEGITDGSITNEKVSDDANIDGAKLNINSVVSKLNEDGTEVIKGTKIEVNGTSLVTQLSTMTSKQTEQGEKISQNTSSIKANENAIKLKVDNQTYQTDKTNMTSTLNKHTSEISTLQDEISLKVEQTDIETANNALKSEIQEDLNDINERINDILSDVGGAIADGIIEESETIMINSSITQLNKEKETLTQRYNYIYDLSTLESSMKSSLKTTMDTYNAKQSALVSHIQSMITDKTISDSERAAYETRLTEYSTALANINKKIEECMDSISTSKVNTAKAEIKVTTDSISQSVTNLSNTVSTKADGSTVSTLSSKVGSLETSVDGITGQVSNLEKSTTSLGSQVSDLEGEITTVKSDVASLEVTTSGISQKVSSVESTTSTLSTKVTTIEDTANSASTNAASALNKANSAIEKADDAKDTADTAIETAEGANTTAGNALSTANTANNTANTNKNNITTLQTTVTTTNNKVAELTTNLDGITQRVQSTESSIQNTNNMLSEVSTGVNKVLFEMYSKTGQDGTEIVTIDDYLDATLLHTLLLDDFQMFGGADEYLGKMTTHLYFNENVTHTVQAFADDGSSIYLNGTLVVSMPTCTDTPVTLNFKQGWNKIVWVYNEGNGGDGCRFTPSIKTLGGLVHMNAYPVNGDIEGLQAINSTVKTTNNRVAEIVTNLDSITQRVSSNETATLNTQTQLNNLQIGGTNTFSLENFNVPEINYWEENQVICNKTNRGFDVETRQGKLHLRLFHVIKENGYWTVSFKYKSSIPVDPIYVDICDLGVGQLSSTTDWKTFKGTVYVDHYEQGEVYNFVDIEQHINVGGYVKYEFKDVKVEKGNKATQWSANPNDVQQQIDNTTNEISTTNNRVAEIVTNLDGITQRVSSNETTIQTTNNKIDNLQVGGRNLIIGISEDAVAYGANQTEGLYYDIWNWSLTGLDGSEYVISFDARADDELDVYCYFYEPSNTTRAESSDGIVTNHGDGQIPVHLTTEWKRYWIKWTHPAGYTGLKHILLGRTYTLGITAYIKNVKFEKGNIATAWTPAPEDVQGQINETNSRVENTSNRVAEIITNLDGITQRVSSNESTTSTLTTQMSQVDGKIDNAKYGAIYEATNIKDTRNDNQPPSWYMDNYGNRTIDEFKLSHVLGIQGDSVFGTLTTKVPWGDASGGYPTQTFISSFTQTFERKGVSWDTWGEWVQVENIHGSQAKANQALNDAKAFTTTEVTKTNDRVAEIVTNLDSITSRVSATETLTETTKNELANIKIGGRNLIKNGSFKGSAPGKYVSTFDYWRVWGVPLLCYQHQNIEPYNETGFIYIQNSDFNNATPTGIHSNRIPVSQLKKNAEYTVSYYYGRESNVLDGTARLEFLNEAQNQIVHVIQLSNSRLNMPIKPSEEYKTKITFTMPNIEFSYLQIVFDHTGLVEGHNGGSILTIIGQVQLEEGNKATEWKPSFEETEDFINNVNNNLTTNYSTTSQMNTAIEQKANQITQSVSQSYATKEEVNTIGVGGTNLLLHSSDYSDTSIWIREGAGTTSSKYRGTCIYTTVREWADIGYSVNNLYDRGVIEPNTKYTFSCYVRSNNEAYQPNIHFYGHDNHSEQGAYVATASTTWKRISITFQWYNFSIRDYPIRFEATTGTPQSGCYLEWAGFKLEKGTKATDWTPAPEDSTESENKWLFEKYASDLANNPTATYPTFDDIKPGCLLSSELVSYFSSTGDYGSTYLGKLTASFYFEADSTQTLTCTTDDNSSWYLNGQLVDVAYSCQPKQITFYFKKGWNKLTVLYLEGYGGDGVSVEGLSGYTKMNAYNMGNIDEYGIYLNNKLISNYATKSEVTQTATDLTVKFTESGGVNLLHNGHAYRDQQGDIPYWSNNGGSVFDIHGNAGGGVRGNFFSLSMPSGMQYNDWIELKGNTHYVYQAQVWVGSPFTGSHNVPLHYWFSSNKSDVNKNGSVEFLDYNTTVSYAQTWTQIYIHFRTTEDVYMKPFIYGIDSSISPFYITEIMLSESRVVQRYSPHPSEVYDGITKIDKDGIQVSQSNISTTTKMNANGFYINKGGTDVFKVDSNGLVMNGNVTATSGRVANFTISGNDLIGSSVGMGGASGNNYAFWAGSNTSSSAPFRVGHNGALTATNATISGNISGSTISGSSFSSYGTNSDSGQSQSMSLDSGLLSLEGSFTGGTNAGQQANKTYVYSNGIVVKDISASGNAGNGDAFYSNTGISFRAKSSGGEQYGSLSKIMTFGSDRISTTKNMYAEKFYGAGLFCTYTNLYLGCDGEVRATDMNGRNDGNTVYKPIRASKFMRADGKHAYINNTGGGTLTSADSALVANGMRTDATDFFLGVGGQVRVTDKNGYNNGNGLTYKPITASAHNNSSDLIFKKNIKKLDDSKNIKMFSENKESFAIKTLKDVTVYEYDLVDGEENQIGLIAQECPQVLRGSDAMYDLDIETANSITDEERKELINEDVVGASINLYSMATMLWKVCQEQQTMIEKLEKRISELENKVTE